MISIIRKPILTEKGMSKNGDREYHFYVEPAANKIQIKQAVKEMFDVEVEDVRTANVKGKRSVKHTKKRFDERENRFEKESVCKIKRRP